MRERIEKLYQFDELSDGAKDKARDWYRQGLTEYTDWAEHALESAVEAGQMLGIRFGTRTVKLMGGGTRQDPVICWDLDRGRGLGFSGWYHYAKGSAQKIRAEWPQDKTLHAIADQLRQAQQTGFYALSARIDTAGRDGTGIRIEAERTDGISEITDGQTDAITEALEDFAHWTLGLLDRELEWIHSDENVDESIRANEYEFTENGERA